MARVHGSHGQVAFADASPIVVIASLNKWSLNKSRDRVDATCFGDTNKVVLQGLPDIKGNLGGFWDPGDGSPQTGGNEALFDAAEGEDPVTLRLTPTTLQEDHYNQGLAYLDASIDVAVNGAVTISGSFAAAGSWSRQ